MKKITILSSFLFVLYGCTAFKSYDQIAWKGMPKYYFFDSTAVYGLAFQQIYYNKKTQKEAFILIPEDFSHEETIISVFESVTKPTECPFSSISLCPEILYPSASWLYDFKPYMGNGILKDTYDVGSLASMAAKGDVDAIYLQAAYTNFNKQRNSSIHSIMAKNAWGESERNLAKQEWYRGGKRLDELKARDKVYKKKLEYRTKTRNKITKSRESRNEDSYQYKSNKFEEGNNRIVSSEETSNDSSFTDKLIDAAIAGWINKELGMKSAEEELEKIAKDRKNISRVSGKKEIKKEERREKINQMLKKKPNVGCEKYGCR